MFFVLNLSRFVAYKTRNMRKEYRDNMQLLLTMYNIALVGSVIVVVINVAERLQATARVFITIGILWVTVFSSCIFVVPKLFQIRSRKLNTREMDELTRRTLSIVGNVPNSLQRLGRRISHRYSQNSNSFGDQSDECEDSNVSSGTNIQTTSIKQPMEAIQESRNHADDDVLSEISPEDEQLSKRNASSGPTTSDKFSTGDMSRSITSSLEGKNDRGFESPLQ